MITGGHVIRFLEHPLLPATKGPDYPKIVKHGINDDGSMHPKSPHCSGPDGAATLLYKMGKEDWLGKLMDHEGVQNFELEIKHQSKSYEDVYVRRNGLEAELGFRSEEGLPSPGTRYQINNDGEWKPISTCDLNSGWGGTPTLIRAQGEAFCKALWYHKRWSKGQTIGVVTWSNITPIEEASNLEFIQQFSISEPPTKKRDEEFKRKENETDTQYMDRMEANFKTFMATRKLECRGGCGGMNSKLICSGCKDTRYCSSECQKLDWKYHKSICKLTDEDY